MTHPITTQANKTNHKPVILVTTCARQIDGMVFHAVASKYVEAVRLAGGQPLLVPYATEDELEGLLQLASGILLTGSPSNVHPRHFGQDIHDPLEPLDELRDSWTLPLIPRAIKAGLPVFAICRGLQELNVALGGSLHQAVHELPEKFDHRMPKQQPEHVQYGAAHEAKLMGDGRLRAILGMDFIHVNSLHGQAIDRLGQGLRIDAVSPDGVIEAVSAQTPGFVLAVQWHPEWHAEDNPVSMKLLKAFGQACVAYREQVP